MGPVARPVMPTRRYEFRRQALSGFHVDGIKWQYMLIRRGRDRRTRVAIKKYSPVSTTVPGWGQHGGTLGAAMSCRCAGCALAVEDLRERMSCCAPGPAAACVGIRARSVHRSRRVDAIFSSLTAQDPQPTD